MTLALVRPSTVAIGQPQIAPALPRANRIALFLEAAHLSGIDLMPWQTLAAKYLTAKRKDGSWAFPEIAIVLPRQNGKTTLLKPRIIAGLLAGERIMHTAQNRELPREIFNEVAETVPMDLMRHAPRVANGQERIDMQNGGVYRIVAPTRGGARGPSNDLVIVDETREFESMEFVAAAKPTLTVSDHPQILYLSNAGSDASLMLNTLRLRSSKDPDLGYLEWSAPDEYPIDDRHGWRVANPAHLRKPGMMAYLEREYRANLDGGTLSIFETEHLCRWVISMRPKVVNEEAWLSCRSALDDPQQPALGFNMSPDGKTATAVIAWQMSDGRIGLTELRSAIGEPIDVDALGSDLQELCQGQHIRKAAFASWTDGALARYLPRAKACDGKDFAQASEQFARYVAQGRIAWDDAPHVTEDLGWTSRRPHESGAWSAVPASPERSSTAALAAIRAVWLASAPKPAPPRIG